jgi:hypothetical protein
MPCTLSHTSKQATHLGMRQRHLNSSNAPSCNSGNIASNHPCVTGTWAILNSPMHPSAHPASAASQHACGAMISPHHQHITWAGQWHHVATACRHPTASTRPAEASMWPLSAATSNKAQASKPSRGWATPQPTHQQHQQSHAPQQHLGHNSKGHALDSTWATPLILHSNIDPSPSNPPSLVNKVGLHHPQHQPSQLKACHPHALAWWSARVQGTPKLPP